MIIMVMIRRNLAVTLIRPNLYARNMPANVARVASTAWATMPEQGALKHWLTAPMNRPSTTAYSRISGTLSVFLKAMTSPSTSVPIMPPIQSANPAEGLFAATVQPAGAVTTTIAKRRERLHDDVVHGDPTGVGRAGRRLVVQVLQLLGAHPRGSGLAGGCLLRGAGPGPPKLA